MEGQLEQRRVLNRLGLDALDAVDVEEVVLVVVRDVAFHLRRAHAAIGLSDVDHRQVEIWKDVGPHSSHRENGSECHEGHRDEHRDRPT
jgi:hypothetical protein